MISETEAKTILSRRFFGWQEGMKHPGLLRWTEQEKPHGLRCSGCEFFVPDRNYNQPEHEVPASNWFTWERAGWLLESYREWTISWRLEAGDHTNSKFDLKANGSESIHVLEDRPVFGIVLAAAEAVKRRTIGASRARR